jgi:hypothetical protein
MGLETGTRIEDLVATNPANTDTLAQADDHLRLIKACVKGSFPSLGSNAVSVTAAEINDVANKLVSFNGRTATAAVPASGDYELMDINSKGLNDVNITAPQDRDRIRYDSGTGKWIRESQFAGLLRLSQAQLTSKTYSSVGATPVKLEIDATNVAAPNLTVDTSNNRLTNDTSEILIVSAVINVPFAALIGSTDLTFELKRNGVSVGEPMSIEAIPSILASVSLQTIQLRFAGTLGPAQYLECFLTSATTRNVKIGTGGTFEYQVI